MNLPMSSIPVNWIATNGPELSKAPAWRGLIHENDVQRLLELRHYLDKAFSFDLAKNAAISATNTRGKAFCATKAIDGDPETYWATDDEVLEASLELDFKKPVEVNAVLIQEFIPLGQRVKSFSIDAYFDNTCNRVAKGVTIGNRRIVKFETVNTRRLRINLEAKACPLIANIEVYRVPDIRDRGI